ncbi:MAG: histidine kinase [Caldisericaceae bacterium]
MGNLNFVTNFYLYIWLFQSLTVIITVAFFLTQTSITRFLFNLHESVKKQILLGIFFGLISVLGTLLGIRTHDAIANIRDIGAISGGLFGGPIVGFIAGLIGGGHRASLGGFTGNSCALATILNGIFAGLLFKFKKREVFSPLYGFLFAIVAESFHLLLVLLISPPFDKALTLIKAVAGPMITSNAVGVGLFLLVIQVSLREREIVSAITAEKVLTIAQNTMPILSKGLNRETADITARMILANTNLDAVGITDTEKILAFRGLGEDHHKPLLPFRTTATAYAIKTGNIVFLSNRMEIGCSEKKCPLGSGIVVPLKNSEGEVFGTLKLYRKEEKALTFFDEEMAKGLANILSLQVELNRLETEKRMKTLFQLKALQARINPHFLFNTLNTISYVVRIDPSKGRELINKLAFILRSIIEKEDSLSTLSSEIELVKSYLEIEKERFKDRLTYEFNIDNNLLSLSVPSLVLQPIVENAVKHGFSLTKRSIDIKIIAYRRGNYGYITIEDNGKGISNDVLNGILERRSESIGLGNVFERIKNLYGNKGIFKIKSNVNAGTKVIIGIPMEGVSKWILEQLSLTMRNLQEKR